MFQDTAHVPSRHLRLVRGAPATGAASAAPPVVLDELPADVRALGLTEALPALLDCRADLSTATSADLLAYALQDNEDDATAAVLGRAKEEALRLRDGKGPGRAVASAVHGIVVKLSVAAELHRRQIEALHDQIEALQAAATGRAP